MHGEAFDHAKRTGPSLTRLRCQTHRRILTFVNNHAAAVAGVNNGVTVLPGRGKVSAVSSLTGYLYKCQFMLKPHLFVLFRVIRVGTYTFKVGLMYYRPDREAVTGFLFYFLSILAFVYGVPGWMPWIQM